MANDENDNKGLKKDDLPEICLPAEVMDFFRVGETTFKRWLKEGRFPNQFKVGNGWRIPRQDVLNFAEELYGKRG